MPPRVMLTGAAGFVGRRLADRLGAECRGLVRRAVPGEVSWEPVIGDLLEPDSWSASLDGVETVVHLAALTGKAPADEHRRVNEQGTECLVQACRERGVRRLVLVSTIAVRFADLRRYPYAEAKKNAEAAVRDSGVGHLIVRPTMVLGEGSPILAALEKLAGLPVMPVFGHGRTPVQPVHVDDLVAVLESTVREPVYDGRILEVGGPTRLPIESLLRAIRRRLKGKEGPVLHLPLGPLLPLLAAGETVAFNAMPFTVGQMATFRFDGTADEAKLPSIRVGRDIDAMIGGEPR